MDCGSFTLDDFVARLRRSTLRLLIAAAGAVAMVACAQLLMWLMG